jgi:chromosome segregation ATPase
MLMTEYCRLLIVKRPVKVETVLPHEARVALAEIPVLKKKLTDMTKNWETRKAKYADLEKKLTEQTAKTAEQTKQVADLAARNKAIAHRESLLKQELDDLVKNMSTPREFDCECGKKIRVDLLDEVPKRPAMKKP